MSEEEARDIAAKVGLAALKYGDLSNQASKDYVFDLERFTSFEGNTGPYILYTIVRIKSILEKFKESGKNISPNMDMLPAETEVERELMLQISRFSDMIHYAYDELAPIGYASIYLIWRISLVDSIMILRSFLRIIVRRDRHLYPYDYLIHDILSTCIDLLGFEALTDVITRKQYIKQYQIPD